MKLPLFLSILVLSSCSDVKQKTRETLNEGGELVGKAVTEVAEGVSEGVDRTLECTLEMSPSLMARGLRTGKFTIGSDSGSNDNMVTVYLITEKDFSDTLLVKVFDKDGLETGRTRKPVSGKAGEAAYYDFIFDMRTNIEVRSKIVLD